MTVRRDLLSITMTLTTYSSVGDEGFGIRASINYGLRDRSGTFLLCETDFRGTKGDALLSSLGLSSSSVLSNCFCAGTFTASAGRMIWETSSDRVFLRRHEKVVKRS